MRTQNFRAVPKRCQEIYNDPAITVTTVQMFDRHSDEISIANPDDTVRNLTSQPAGIDIVLQSMNSYGAERRISRKGPPAMAAITPSESSRRSSPSFTVRSIARRSVCHGDELSVWSIRASET